jgi:hypothetical protein
LAAEQTADPEVREIVLGVALAYERIAAHAGRQELKALTKLPRYATRSSASWLVPEIQVTGVAINEQ